MRNPDRIPIILDAIRKAWEKNPDLRLCQLIVNAVGEDPFYTEDEVLSSKLQENSHANHQHSGLSGGKMGRGACI